MFLRRSLSLLAFAMFVAVSIIPLHAQEVSSEWSRIHMSFYCYGGCPPRVGLGWDSTNAKPRYPEVMRSSDVAGEVVVGFLVGVDGKVDPVSVKVGQITNRAFAQSAIDAVQTWHFNFDREMVPPAPVPVEVSLIYAHFGFCGTGLHGRLGVAGENRFVVIGCNVRVDREQLRTRK